MNSRHPRCGERFWIRVSTGNLLSSRNVVIQRKLAENRYRGMYPPVLALDRGNSGTLVALVTWSGRERKARI